MISEMRRLITLCEAVRAYHGSSLPDPVFEPQHTGSNSHTFGPYKSTRHGIFFSNSRTYAALYGQVGQYRLNVHHTLDLENDNNTIWNFVQSFDPHDPDQRNTWLEARAIMHDSKHWQLFEDEVGERFVPYLQKLGYDSATFEEYADENGKEFKSRTTVVFDPSQVKRLATK
jgi:hypothetical protein